MLIVLQGRQFTQVCQIYCKIGIAISTVRAIRDAKAKEKHYLLF